MITIGWPTQNRQVYAEVWRILDLSGLTKSVRESIGYTKSGYVYLNGSNITSLKQSVSTGEPFRLELRFPNGRIKGADIMVVPSTRHTTRLPRQASPGVNYYIKDPDKLNYRG